MAYQKKSPEEVAASRKRSLEALAAHNLKNRTPEERREIARMGNLAQQNVRKRRKTFREIIEALGTMDATDAEKEKFLQMFPGADRNEITKDMMLIASMYNQAVGRGNVKAAGMIRDTAGEKPDTNITGSITTEKIFITQEEKKATIEHIQKVIADGNGDQ
jgi:hypothetical protein